eukprot:2086397-Rhodomonas_salina.1
MLLYYAACRTATASVRNTSIVWCYAMHGTDIAYGTTRPLIQVRDRRGCPSVLPICYEMSGTDPRTAQGTPTRIAYRTIYLPRGTETGSPMQYP